MGLLQRAIAINANADSGSASGASDPSSELGGVETLLADFSRKNPSFYCVVLQGDSLEDIPPMTFSHGAACADLPGRKCLVLLPPALDGELFAHRLSKSTDSLVLYQTSVNSVSLALEMLRTWIQEE